MAIPNYYEDLFTPEQMSDLKYQGISQGLLGLGQALSQAGAPSLMPQGSGISQGLAAFNQGYSGTMDKALGDMLKGAQVKQMIEKQKQDAQLKKLYATAMTPQYQVTPAVVPQGQTMLDDQGMPTYGVTPEQKTLTGYKYDMKQIVPMLQAMGRFDELKGIAESQKALRQSGIMGDTNAPSPFAPYVMAQSPQVRQLAQTYEQGFKTGVIDEDTAYKRTEALASMEDRYLARKESAADRALTREQGGKPTADELKAAGFAQRMEFSEGKLKEVEGKVAAQQLKDPNTKYQTPFESTGTQLAGGVPLIGGWARSKVATEQQKAYRQAQENWVRANLRKESGAVIGDNEMNAEIATYFPMPNDPASVVKQKNDARQVTMNAMRMSAGKSYQPFDPRQFALDNGLEPRK